MIFCFCFRIAELTDKLFLYHIHKSFKSKRKLCHTAARIIFGCIMYNIVVATHIENFGSNLIYNITDISTFNLDITADIETVFVHIVCCFFICNTDTATLRCINSDFPFIHIMCIFELTLVNIRCIFDKHKVIHGRIS